MGNIPDTVVILRDQAEESPLCQQLYSCQWWSLKVRYTRLKSGIEVGDRNVNKGNREYPVKEDNRNIQESVRQNEKETDDPVGSEANPKVLEMSQAVGGGGEASEGHGGSGDKPWQLCLLCQMMEGAGYVWEFGDEPAIEVHKPHKGLNLSDILWGWPILNTGDLDRVHFDTSLQENKT